MGTREDRKERHTMVAFVGVTAVQSVVLRFGSAA